MRKLYEALSVDVVKFEAQDMITGPSGDYAPTTEAPPVTSEPPATYEPPATEEPG